MRIALFFLLGLLLTITAYIARTGNQQTPAAVHEDNVGASEQRFRTTKIHHRIDCTQESKTQLDSSTEQLRLGNVNAAISTLQDIISKDRSCNAAYHNLGTAYYYSANYLSSEEMYLKAAKNEPKNPLPLAGLGVLYSKIERNGDSISYYQRALELAPDDPHINKGMGFVYFSIGDRRNGEKYLRKFLSLSPDSLDAAAAINLLSKPN